MTLKRELKVLKAKKLGGAASLPTRRLHPWGMSFAQRGVRGLGLEQEGWYPGEGGCSGQVPGLGGEQEVEDLLEAARTSRSAES